MRVHFDNVDFNAPTGPNTFAARLARKLFENGHEVLGDAAGADVSLVFIEPTGRPLAPRVVQRLDGIWFKPEDFQTKNVGIRKLYERADAIVWQSLFDRRMTLTHFGFPRARRCEVIHNGIDLTPVKAITIPKLAEMRAAYDKIYVCSSNWHPQKRLGANIKLFNRLRQKHPNSCLIVLGNHPDVRLASPHIFFSGSVSPEVYLQIYAAANWMLHLAWADHCPNVVIEALSQGTPVACSEVGGTKELVGSYGVVLKEAPYNYELADYDNPPDIDVTQIDDLPDRQQLEHATADIDINNVAKRYVQLFEEVGQ